MLKKSVFILFVFSHIAFAQFDEDEPFTPPTPVPAAPTDNPASGSLTRKTGVPAAKPGSTEKIVSKKEKLAQAGIEDITNENFSETIESFDFPNADISDVVKAIGELTGKNFIIDPQVRGKISIIAPSKITVAEAYKAFLSALAMNKFAVVPAGKFLKIRSIRSASRDGVEAYSGNYYPNSDQLITRIIHLKHIPADLVQQQLRLLQPDGGEWAIYTPTNSIIVTDYGSSVDRIMKILAQLDVPGFDDQMEVVRVRFAKVKDMAELITKIVNKGETKSPNSGGFSAGIPRAGRSSTQTNGAYFLVFPDERTNSLIVVGNKAGIDRVKKLVAQLDFRIRPDENGGVHVYYMKFGDAEKIAETLQGIAKDASPKPSTGGGPTPIPQFNPITGNVQPSQDLFGGDVKIKADKGSNSLVIIASKQDYEIVLNLLEKIDIPRDQVYVEAIIMEMSVADAQNWKIGFYQYAEGIGLHSGFGGFSSTELSSLLNPVGGSGAILGFGSGSNVTITPSTLSGATSTSSFQIPSLVGFINFLKTNAHGNVLSTPQVLALDNQEALIQVGDKVVTKETQTVGTGGVVTTTPEMEEALIELKIKPIISPVTSKIRMELESSVSQPSNIKSPSNFEGKVQPLAKRKVKTNIVVPNGDTAVLGGMMKDLETESVTKVPLLGDIPILGWLFKSRETKHEKSNLVIFLTPKIIRDADDHKKILNRKVDERLGFIKDMGGKDPYGTKVDEIQGIQAVKEQTEGTKK